MSSLPDRRGAPRSPPPMPSVKWWQFLIAIVALAYWVALVASAVLLLAFGAKP